MANTQQYGELFFNAASGVATASAVGTATSGIAYYVTDISASSDIGSATVTLTVNGVTAWKQLVGAGIFDHTFSEPLHGSASLGVTLAVTGSTACYASIGGYKI